MKVLIISCSKNAYELALKVSEEWQSHDPQIQIEHVVKTKMLPELSVEGKMEDYVREHFTEYELHLFICATGIAVRAIAPVLKHKSVDPAVVVLDDKAKHCISLLSGHAGGANAYTHMLAAMTGADPVITTASDLDGRFAVDVFARENGLVVANWKTAKFISVEILSGKEVGFLSDFPVEGTMPEGLVPAAPSSLEETKLKTPTSLEETEIKTPAVFKETETKISEFLEETETKPPAVFEGQADRMYIHITDRKKEKGNDRCLKLLVPDLILGIGCRKDTPQEMIEDAVTDFLKKQEFDLRAVSHVASIDLKAKEPGLLGFANKHRLSLHTYSAEELAALEGEFSESGFVESVTGVSNVCERAAVAEGGHLVVRKTRYPQVTIALARRSYNIKF